MGNQHKKRITEREVLTAADLLIRRERALELLGTAGCDYDESIAGSLALTTGDGTAKSLGRIFLWVHRGDRDAAGEHLLELVRAQLELAELGLRSLGVAPDDDDDDDDGEES